jgi:predicted phosphodiesterase
MAAKNGKIDVAREYIEKYIQLGIKHNRGYSKKYIATVLSEDRPDLFKNIEDARTFVRAATNTKGFRDHSKAGEDLARRFALIESPYSELKDSEPLIIPKQYKNTLVLSDQHSRFYDRRANMVAIDYGVKNGCDSVIINGDFMDFYRESKFDKSAMTVEAFLSEQDWGVEMLRLLQDCFGKVFLKLGNHDARREAYQQRLALKYGEYVNLSSYEEYLDFEGSTVVFVPDYTYIKYGKLYIIHGHEYSGGGIHVAYNRLNKTMVNTLSGHSHITQGFPKTNLAGEVFGSWTTGCLCDLHPRYNPLNNWNLGFARVERDSTGDFEVLNKRIYNGKIMST